jgi:hypothetical protein
MFAAQVPGGPVFAGLTGPKQEARADNTISLHYYAKARGDYPYPHICSM